uniref:Uncharacterized protein n=1 Tax=Oryza punctata TaxID=4537 RepID=A0A0E0MNF3_ORYPU
MAPPCYRRCEAPRRLRPLEPHRPLLGPSATGMTRSRTAPHSCAVPVLVTSTPLVFDDANLLPDDDGDHPSSVMLRSSSLASSPCTLARSSASERGDGAPPSHLHHRPPLPPLLVCEATPSVVGGGAVPVSMGDRGLVGER